MAYSSSTVCTSMYVLSHTNPARGQLNRDNKYFPVCVRSRLRIWSRETGSAIPPCVSLLISMLRLNLVLTYGTPPEFRGGGVHLFVTGYLLYNALWSPGTYCTLLILLLFSGNMENSCNMCVCVCVCVIIPFILDVRLVDAPAGVTQEFSTFMLRCLP